MKISKQNRMHVQHIQVKNQNDNKIKDKLTIYFNRCVLALIRNILLRVKESLL